MRGKVAKMLMSEAERQTVGQSITATILLYKVLKADYLSAKRNKNINMVVDSHGGIGARKKKRNLLKNLSKGLSYVVKEVVEGLNKATAYLHLLATSDVTPRYSGHTKSFYV